MHIQRIRLIALLTLIMMMVSFQGNTQETHSIIVTITVSVSDRVSSQILTIDSEGNASTIPLKALDVKNYDENLKLNNILIQKEINKWLSKGYKISSTVNMDSGGVMLIFTND